MNSNNRNRDTAPGPSRGSNTNNRNNNRGRFHTFYRRNHNQQGPPRQRPTSFSVPNEEPAENFVIDSSQLPPGTNAGQQSQPLLSIQINPPTNNRQETFAKWKLYFPQEEHQKDSPTNNKVKTLVKHFRLNGSAYPLQEIKKQKWFKFKLVTISNDENIKRFWPNFLQDLRQNPEYVLAAAGLAMDQLVSQTSSSLQLPGTQVLTPVDLALAMESPNSTLATIRPCLLGYTEIQSLASIKSSHGGNLVAVRGTIIRVGAFEIVCTWMAFQCPSCNAVQSIRQPDGVATTPTSCQTSGCRARSNFEPILNSPYTRTEAYQTISVQDCMPGCQFDNRNAPLNIDVELTEDMVEVDVSPGDDIVVTGILKFRLQEEFQRNSEPSMIKMYIQAVSVIINKTARSNRDRESEFTRQELEIVKRVSEAPNTFRRLVHSLCPSIYGHEMVKCGLLLGLFGGTNYEMGKRTEIHVLVVGDPGVGKSQMLQACANISPRGIYVCGKSTTNAGLTASVRQEKGTIASDVNGSLEAGALVLADQGACCIDEFDKMVSNHQSFLEVMEQQTVSIAKAGTLCSIPARTSVLACANPRQGQYDRSRSVSENLNIKPALLSRFDLVFIILDQPDRHMDNLKAEHIQALHAANLLPVNSVTSPFFQTNTNSPEFSSGVSHSIVQNGQNLLEFLKQRPGENLNPLSHNVMQSYIAYARKNIHPKLSEEAAAEVKKFYTELRVSEKAFPVTTRQLEGLIRLTHARARSDLSPIATRKHALDVLALVRYSFIDVFDAGDGTLQLHRSINGAGLSQASQVKKFIKLLQQRVATIHQTVFTTNELKEIASYGGLSANVTHLIEALNIQGFLLKKGNDMYKFLID